MKRMLKKVVAAVCVVTMVISASVCTVFAEETETEAKGIVTTAADGFEWTEDTKLTFTNGSSMYVITFISEYGGMVALEKLVDDEPTGVVQLSEDEVKEVSEFVMSYFMDLATLYEQLGMF